MLKPLQKLPQDQTLVAHSGVQFIDYGFRLSEEFSFNRMFLEVPEAEQEAGEHDEQEVAYRFHQIETNRNGPGYVNVETREPITEKSTYSVAFARALEIFDSAWLPVPYLKNKGVDDALRETFEQGPFNWCRIRITKLSDQTADDYTHRVTLAFDTTTREAIKGWPYISPVTQDVDNESRFFFASDLRDISWFLHQPWVTGWLKDEMRLSAAAAKPIKRGDGEEAICTYWAFYTTLLQGLRVLMNGKDSNALLPRVYFINTFSERSQNPIEVDLVLDIGNSRTCGVLIETGAEDGLDIEKAASVLELRDISRPEFAYREPFRSHVEFAPAEFGHAHRSRESGSPGIFKWPSWVRVGPEALRLCDKSSGTDGDTGISGPKRYIWDERENRQPWRFNVAESRLRNNQKVSGELMLLVTNDGEQLKFAGPKASPALDPKFSRASLFTFMVMEIVLQAIVQINSVDYRAVKKHPNVNRRLRRILFTIPTATPLVEKEKYEKRCKAAISLLWETYEWNKLPTGAIKIPDVNIEYDEATCTQIVYLYNEISKKLELTPSDMFRLLGRTSFDGRADRLRIASLDIGGGTTDLMIVSYSIDPPGSDTLAPVQNFREGFRKAGDDILEAVISRHVLTAIEAALADHGVPNPKQKLQEFMSPGRNALQRQLRKLFVSRILAPIALHLLSQYETAANMVGDARDQETFKSILREQAETLSHVIKFFEDQFVADGKPFSLMEVKIGLDFDRLGATIQSVMGDIIALMCEVIHKFDCDVLMLTGRPSCFPIIRDLILRYLPIAPHRLIFMHEYKVGNWYPFAGRQGKIDDPKTTVVVGALICALAEKREIRDFPLRGGGFSIKSTARYIGRLLGADTLRTDDIIFSQEGRVVTTESKPFVVSAPMFLGFRQLKLDRWPGTPLFFLDLAEDHPARRSAPMPWKVTLGRNEPSDDDPPAKQELDMEKLWIRSVVDQAGNDAPTDLVRIRLQTMHNVDGYWLDTGTVAIAEND